MPTDRTVPALRLTLEVIRTRPELPSRVVYQRTAEAESFEQHGVLIPWLLELARISGAREERRIGELLGLHSYVHVELPDAADAL